MAQFDYCGTLTDSLDLVRAILSNGFSFVTAPRILLPDEIRRYDSWSSDLEAYLRSDPEAYIVGSFTTGELGLEPITQEPEKGKYYLDPSHGGPVLGFSVAPSFDRDGRLDLGPGRLWHQPRYRDQESGEWHPPTPELKAAFKTVRKLMRSRLVQYALPGGSKVDIGPRALDAFLAGKASIRWRGKDYASPTS